MSGGGMPPVRPPDGHNFERPMSPEEFDDYRAAKHEEERPDELDRSTHARAADELVGAWDVAPRSDYVSIAYLTQDALQERARAANIILPDTVVITRGTTARVRAVGRDVDDLEVGDYVIVSPYAGIDTKLEDDGDTFSLVRNQDVLAVVIPRGAGGA